MTCLNCYTINDENVIYCKKCGKELPLPTNADNTKSDKFLLAFICIAFLSNVIQFILPKIFNNMYEGTGRYMQAFFWILQNLSWFLVAFSIKDKNLKTAALIIASLLIMYWIYSNVGYMFSR